MTAHARERGATKKENHSYGFTTPSEKQRERAGSCSSSESGGNPRPRGFTLIELLVVIAIIGVLSAVVMSSLSAARTSARDAKRKSDLQQISKALELYYLTTGTYPGEYACDSSIGTHMVGCPAAGTDWDPTSYIHVALVPTYIADLPVDPVNNTTYYYTYEPQVGGSDYCLAVPLEKGGRYRVKNGDTAINC